ncbi:hypothetical protein FACS1894202_14000 [Clostridia bacterium]|nr:hypothetical protein FACS1894202_14000 [Clostridia bacterium]
MNELGDLWLCCGQSNMEMTMGRVARTFPGEMSADNPHIRQFAVPQEFDFDAPRDKLTGGEWKAVTPETVADFTAVGYFFAKHLWERYRKPIGLISASVGGTPIAAWTRGTCGLSNADAAELQRAEAARAARYYEALDASETDGGEWVRGDIRDIFCAEPGIVWFRKTINIPPEFAGKPGDVFLGTLLDGDQTYLNGVKIGETACNTYTLREYHADSLPSGACTLEMRVVSGSRIFFTQDKPRFLMCENRGIDLNGEWEYRRAATAEALAPEPSLFQKPHGLYNGMLYPCRDFPVKGVIWYQGESDAENASGYAEKFAELVADMRGLWGNVPVIAVGLAEWGESDWNALRREQIKALNVPNTALVYAFDVGEHNDIHPQNKRVVGDRLARAARILAYGEKLPNSPYEVLSP